MDMQHKNVPVIDDLERKAIELTSLILTTCEERIRKASMPDARTSSLVHAAMAAQYAIQSFLALHHIS